MNGIGASSRGGQHTLYRGSHMGRRSLRALACLLLLLAMTISARAQMPAQPHPPQLPPQTAPPSMAPGSASSVPNRAPSATGVVEITLERQRGEKVEPMAAGHVFAKGDVIRLRVTSHYDGFLYVMDQGTSGKFATVFPGTQTGSDNRVRMAQQYLVPADGWFEVDGPAGFDVLYFLLSPAALSTPAISAFAAPGPVSSLKPRCNDEIFRARGDCTDDSAGPTAVPQGQDLPAPLAPIAGSASRDITFINKGNGTVGVQGEGREPMLYTFRLAHL